MKQTMRHEAPTTTVEKRTCLIARAPLILVLCPLLVRPLHSVSIDVILNPNTLQQQQQHTENGVRA
jgi:hypothetical protein